MVIVNDIDKVTGSLQWMLVGDALGVAAHWYYSTNQLRKDLGEITEMLAPKKTHSESLMHVMSRPSSSSSSSPSESDDTEIIDIMHDKRRYYGPGNDNVHFHQSLIKGQNTANGCITRLIIRYLAEKNANGEDKYDPDEYLERFKTYMTTPPSIDDKDQLFNHNDTYMDIYLREFFANASKGKLLRDCAWNQRDEWSIGSIDAVVMCIPIIAAYANEPEWYVVGRAVEHAQLTHRSVTATAVISRLVPLLLTLYRFQQDQTVEEEDELATANRLRKVLDDIMEKMSPPKMGGSEMRETYMNHKGPGNIPKYEKWRQHMVLDTSETTKDMVHRLLNMDDEDIAGFGDRPNSRLATACYNEHTFTVVLYLAYKYANNPRKAMLQNVMLGGHTTSRGALLGAILGATYGGTTSSKHIPFGNDLCAKDAITKEINNLVNTLSSSSG